MKKFLVGLAAAGALTAAATPAFATPTLRLTSGATVTVSDNGVGDINPILGAVTFLGAVGVFDLNVTTGLTKPFIGSASLPELDLNNVSTTTSSSGNLKIEFTETGFTTSSAVTAFLSQIGGTISNVVGSGLTYKVYVDGTNTAFGTATEIFSSVADSGAFAAEGLTPVNLLSSPYSITLVADLVHAGAGTSSFDGFTTIPEPATVALLGMGLFGLGMARRRRSDNSSAS